MNTGQIKIKEDSTFSVCEHDDYTEPAFAGRYSMHPKLLYTLSSGYNVYWYKEVDSTNKVAAKIAGSLESRRSVIVSDIQTEGRGRFEREWHSPEGKGLWFSIVVPYDLNIDKASQVTLVSAVAVAEALGIVTGISFGIKWPNDIHVNNKKLCGILTEMNSDCDSGETSLIIGVGINVNMTSEDLSEEIMNTATSLLIETGHTFERNVILGTIIDSFDKWFQIWADHGFEPVRSEWISYNITIGQNISVNSWDETYQGKAVGIDEDGQLEILDMNNKLQKLNSGEVSLNKKF